MNFACTCGMVTLETDGPPILVATCYCDDCQEGGRRMEGLPGAAKVLEADGGTPYVLQRKDRFSVTGANRLKRYKLRDGSITNRVVATCCNSAMFVDFDGGPHWVSLYSQRIEGERPSPEMLINTRFARAGVSLPPGIPAYPKAPFAFIWKLIKARLAMAIGR